MADQNKIDKDNEEIICAFCGRSKAHTDGDVNFIKGSTNSDTYICSDCISLAHGMIEQQQAEIKRAEASDLDTLVKEITPSKIKAHLDQYVIGQEKAKEILSVADYNHYKFLHYWDQENPPVEIEKSNIIMAGPTGVGRLYM